MEPLERDATVVCAHLLREGYLKKSRIPHLEMDERLLRDVQGRLAQTGMELVWNTYSPFYAVRFTREIQDTIEDSNNLGLKNNEIAMLVILWSKLVLPKRLVIEGNNQKEVDKKLANAAKPVAPAQPQPETAGAEPIVAPVTEPNALELPAGESPLVDNDVAAAQGGAEPQKANVKITELYAEFGAHFGSKTTFRAILGRLNNLQFIRVHDELVFEGIFLDLLVDGYQMGNEIKKSALAFKLAGLEEDEELETEEDWDDEVDEANPEGEAVDVLDKEEEK